MARSLATASLFALILTCVACTSIKPSEPAPGQIRAAPRWRVSTYATASMGTQFNDASQPGQHSYEPSSEENNGIIYACRAGHIDLGHLRKAADWTAFLTERTYIYLREEATSFTFKLYEPSVYHVRISYPADWSKRSASEKQDIAESLSIGAGQYFAHIGLTWHEIVTWYDYRITGIWPIFPSAFSWEDTYSNTLGVYVAGKALRNPDLGFDEAMTYALDQEIAGLGPQPGYVSRQASSTMRGRWYNGKILFLVDMMARNLDIGIDDGEVSPWLASPVPECQGAIPRPYPVPAVEMLEQNGVKLSLELDPKIRKAGQIFEAVFPEGAPEEARLEPDIHFPMIMAQIRQQAITLYGEELLDWANE